MNAVIIPKSLLVVPPFGPLKEGVSRNDIISFGSEWCRAYFELSGDINNELHGDEGAGIVQGMAIMTRLGATISRHMTGYMVAKVDEVRFRNPVKIGNQVRMTMERLDSKERATRVKVTLEHMNGLPVTEMTLLLVRM